MPAESVRARLAELTGQDGESSESVYAKWAGLVIPGDGQSLEGLVRTKLTRGAKTAQLRESLLATLRAGGAVGETVEECLRKTGLLGWA